MIADFRELRYFLKFFFKFEKTGTEAIEMLKVPYKDGSIEKTLFFKRFFRFKSGEMLIDDQPRSGRSLTVQANENVKTIREIILKDRQQAIEKSTLSEYRKF